MDPRNTGLLLIAFQNDFVTEGAAEQGAATAKTFPMFSSPLTHRAFLAERAGEAAAA